VRTSIAIEQTFQESPPDPSGTRYRLRVRVRTSHLNRPVQVELKLLYPRNRYLFFYGRAHYSPFDVSTTAYGIPPGTALSWTTIQVDATATQRVDAIEVFAFDSGPGVLRGTVWLAGVELTRST
jgi:hypothetical protein